MKILLHLAMAERRTIAVLGATEVQGGSMVSTFLKAGWHVRAITRNPNSAKAKGLAARGAEVVQADMKSTSTLRTAFESAHVVFAVSDFWGHIHEPIQHG